MINIEDISILDKINLKLQGITPWTLDDGSKVYSEDIIAKSKKNAGILKNAGIFIFGVLLTYAPLFALSLLCVFFNSSLIFIIPLLVASVICLGVAIYLRKKILELQQENAEKYKAFNNPPVEIVPYRA